MLRALLLEDSPRDVEIMRELLADAGFELDMDCTAAEKEFVSWLRSRTYDIILSDFRLPGFDGFTALRWAVDICPNVPFICVSGTLGDETAVELLKMGAVDYVLKDRLTKLPSAIKRALEEAKGKKLRQQADAALKESEEKFRTLADQSPNMIFIYKNGRIVYANARCEEIMGYTREEAYSPGFDPLTLFAPEYREKVAGNILERLAGRESLPYDCAVVTKEGKRVEAILSPKLITYENGKAILSSITDITERKRAEESLAKERNLLRTFIDNMPDYIYAKDAESRFVLANIAIARFMGAATPDELLGKTDMDFHPAERAREYLADERAIIRSGRPLLGKEEQAIDASSGETRWLSSHKVPWLDLGGTVSGLLGISRDITERKRSEEALRKSEEQYRTLFEESIDTVFTSTPKGEFTDINPAGVKLFGYSSKEEMLNLRVADDLFWEPGDRERYLAAMATQGFVKDHELECKTKDGKKIIVLETAIAVRDSNGKIVAHRGILRDITGQKRLEREFLRAQRMESIGTLAGGIAHDLNNVLAPIMMALEILQSKFSDEESTRILHTVATSAKRGSDIVKQILAFGRGVEGERMVIQPKHVFREIQDIATETFPKSIHIKPNIPNNLWTILSDPTQIHQVLLNICVNARDAMPKGGTLTISSENVMLDEFFAASNREAKPGPYVVVTITDTGTGIPPGILERIFDPFFTTKEIGKGTGLGLSTALGIVKNHSGFIDVHSAPGQGTSFKVYLPAQMKEQEAVKEKELPELPPGNGELILVVDDEASICKIAKLTLEANGYQAVTANNGVEAVTICARDKGTIRLVLMDMNMPVMDGPATIRALQMMKTSAKIVATSGASGGDETLMESIPGVRAFLKKPYTAEKLLATLHDVLNEE